MEREHIAAPHRNDDRRTRDGSVGPTVALVAFAIALTGGVFLLDLLANSRVSVAVLYSLVIFYSWLFEGSAPVLGTAVLCTGLAIADVFLAKSRFDDVAGINKVLSVGVIWVSAALVLLVKSSLKQAADAGKRLQAESLKFQTALEYAPNAVLMVDATGTILLVNRQAEILFGYSRRRLLGTSVDLLVPEGHRGEHAALRREFFEESNAPNPDERRRSSAPPGARSMRAGRELTARRKDGREVHVEIGLNPIDTPNGVLVIASIVDISARKLAAKLVDEQHRLKAERLTRELMLAERIQTSILPRPPLAPGIDIAARMVPAAEVGGDYYDVFPADDGCWFAIGDVSGHGLDAGLMSLMVQSATSAILHSVPNIEPLGAIAGINATLHDNVIRRLGRREYVTFTIFRYTKDGTVVHCGAHQDILVWRAATRQVERHPTKGSWLALRSSADAEMERLHLDDGDLLILFTDGLVENGHQAGEMVGLQATVELVNSIADRPAQELVDALIEQTLQRAPQREDDITVLALRHHASA
jgi:PAS domain S-box-containing protein